MRKIKSPAAIAAIVLSSFAVTALISISYAEQSRRTWRMESEKPSGTNNTINFQSNTKTDSSGKSVPASPSDTEKYGADDALHCRVGALQLNRIFDSVDTSQGHSNLPVGDLADGATLTGLPCKSAVPTMRNKAGYPVESGTIDLKCIKGHVSITSANCTAYSPPPPAPTPDPTAVPAGYSRVACGSNCSDAVSYTSCVRSGSTKNGYNYSRTNHYRCLNGQYFRVHTTTGMQTCGAAIQSVGC